MTSKLGNAVNTYLGDKYSLRLLLRFLADKYSTKRNLSKRSKEQKALYSNPGKKKLVHVTSFSVSNAGDNVLSECVRVLFNSFFGDFDWDIVRLHDTVDEKSIERFNSASGVILGGGGVFLPDTNENDISGWQWPCSSEQYESIVPPVIVFAVGYNYFNGQKRECLLEDNIKALVKRSDFFGVRNNGSIHEMQSFLGPELGGGLVFQPCPTMVSKYLYPDLPVKKTTGKIAFNVALDRPELRMGSKEHKILDEIAVSMRLLRERGYEIHFITHCDWEIRFLEYIRTERVKCSYHHATAWETDRILNFYNDMDMVIGMRGHGIWIPYGVNTRILSLDNHNKTRWFLEDIGALDWSVDIIKEAEHLSDKILNKVIEINEEHTVETDRRLVESQKRLWDTTCINLGVIGELLNFGS